MSGLDAQLAWVAVRVDGSSDPEPAPHPPLAAIARTFGLSRFERAVVLLCAAVELQPAVAARWQPTFGLALGRLPEPHWSALAPWAPLRHWRLLSVAPNAPLTSAPLSLDERVLHQLVGVDGLDSRVADVVRPLAVEGPLTPAQAAVVQALGAALTAERDAGRWPCVQLLGCAAGTTRAVAAAACARAGWSLHAARADRLPDRRLWEREAALARSALLIELEDGGETDAGRFLDGVQGPVLLSGREPVAGAERALRFDVPAATRPERRALWRECLGNRVTELNGTLDAVSGQFELEPAALRAAGTEALAARGPLADSVWRACRVRARPRLEDLAERIRSSATWDDLVLPAAERRRLEEIALQVRWRARVYDDWGFAARGSRGLGISALFSGPSGTGKTLAAEVLANELRLDLYRVDVSAVVSKWIGETEKHLRRVFDAAERGGVVLLFDEADALFGARSADASDNAMNRFANLEVGYLLQRMDAYRGLAILTTNLGDAIDDAFVRRLRFMVEFPFPDPEQRAAIWRRAFPPQVPIDGLEFDRLARLNLAGGHIRNVALGASFLAADEGAPVGPRHVQRAARTEYAKLDRPLGTVELDAMVAS
jgi:hypothetical protein